MAGPARYDLEVYQGDTFDLPLRLRSVGADGFLGAYLDLTGSTVRAQVRDLSDAAVRAPFGI